MKTEIAKRLGALISLAYQVNSSTKYNVFVDYSGHIDGVTVRIKEGEREIVHADTAYLDEKWADPTVWFDLVMERLQGMQATGEINESELVVVDDGDIRFMPRYWQNLAKYAGTPA